MVTVLPEALGSFLGVKSPHAEPQPPEIRSPCLLRVRGAMGFVHSPWAWPGPCRLPGPRTGAEAASDLPSSRPGMGGAPGDTGEGQRGAHPWSRLG